jgi:tetraacyldisaccharide 4'-kinase
VKAPRFWLRPRPGLIAWGLSPLGAVYGAATARRMARPGTSVGAPVLCVGNFIVGGAGKTPTALALARLLRAAGERPAFLSRGYGGRSRAESHRVDLATDGARGVGDEPLLLARAAPCYVGADRVASAKLALEDGASVLVMDDGLQNPALYKSLTAAVVDGEAPFGNGLCLPAGPLRAPVAAQAPYVDAVVVIGGGPEAGRQIAKATGGKPLFTARLQADAVAAATLIGRPVLAFAGIARPEKFFATLRDLGAQVSERQTFPDHWAFTPREIERLLTRAARRGLTPVCTEKDFVRLPPDLAAHVRPLPVTLSFDETDAVARWLRRLRP